MLFSDFKVSGREIRRVGVFGLGKSNIGVVEYISKKHPNVTFCLRSDKPIDKNAAMRVALFNEIYEGDHAFDNLAEDVIFLSPSARWDKKEFEEAKNGGVLLSSDAHLFFENFKNEVFAISGSDGKSTTTTLTALLLNERYSTLAVCGNIGRSMSSVLRENHHAAVTELSSFQLMNLKPHSKRSLITNITPNHLDWHSSFDEYVQAKTNLYENAEERVFCADSDITVSLLKKFPAFAIYSATLSEKDLRAVSDAEVYVWCENGFIVANGERLLNVDAIAASGSHNLSNLMAAISMTYGLISKRHIQTVAENFKGLAHRNRLVYQRCGIDFYDSSIDSTPKRTATTLASHKDNVTLILGGKGKGLSYSELCDPINKHAKCVVICGENRDQIYDDIRSCVLKDGKTRILLADSFEDAIISAISETEPGGAVLLSPASTSYDRFANFEERADAFLSIIKNFYENKLQ